MKHIVTLFFTSLLALLALSNTAYAQWSSVAICTAANTQYYLSSVSDGSNGSIITWADQRNTIGGSNDLIYAQRINSSGVVQWTTDGVAICTTSGTRGNPSIISDGAGGAIITWRDNRSGNYDIYAQRINSSGSVVWTADGVAICTAANEQFSPTIAGDGASGAIITWHEWRASSYDIYAQRINASGAVQWTTDGVVISAASVTQNFPGIISDATGGAIIFWNDNRNGNYDIYAQRIDADSSIHTGWTANGVAVCTAAGTQQKFTIVSDALGGAIITWEDYRSGTNYDIYAQRIDAGGSIHTGWTTDGIAIYTATSDQNVPRIAGDGASGAIITWEDYRSDGVSSDGIYAQRIDANGSVHTGWTADGVLISNDAGDTKDQQIVSDGASGAIITFQNSSGNIYAQRIIAGGTVQWAANGVATGLGSYSSPTLVSSGSGGAIIASGGTDIYASQVDGNGLLPVELTTFTANVTNGNVTLNWQTATEVNNYGFEVERGNRQKAVGNSNWEKIGFVQGHGNSNSVKEYSFVDASTPLGTNSVSYRLKQIDNDGKFKYSKEIEVEVSTSLDFSLEQNYPNPFNPSTVISWQSAVSSYVTLKVFNVLGKEVATLVNGEISSGEHSIQFNAEQLPSGVYFYRLTTPTFSQTKSMEIIK